MSNNKIRRLYIENLAALLISLIIVNTVVITVHPQAQMDSQFKKIKLMVESKDK